MAYFVAESSVTGPPKYTHFTTVSEAGLVQVGVVSTTGSRSKSTTDVSNALSSSVGVSYKC